MITTLLPALGLGFLVGFRHAFEPDHLAAVTTMASHEHGVARAARLGVAWGIGHTLSVGLVAVVLVTLGVHVPERFHTVAELGVALMLIVLGVGTLVADLRRPRRIHDVKDAGRHDQNTIGTHIKESRAFTGNPRALGFGILHGLAGSGAVIVLAVAAATDQRTQLSYLGAFGVGSIAGMAMVSALSGATAGLVGRTHAPALRYVRWGAAGLSAVVGVMLGTEVLQSW
ncbi:MAG: hypothetical protein K2Y26_07650 [Gemmatimonadaceae bacterium]|jgi:hypothetical protein|uniref:HoxN/HupN/NixA family nickel/cobalt transporter n=1 Tax=Gemmatimonas sp. UBA7669 TaxID=1946568 RepID=UPI0025C074C8|nr:hypothetical protein [Gemmatimonas sp. UBA7669]MBA3917246.1 hypothetical protein [Gemmatimonas sp.]MBL0890239.1 hypothetical protein [Gemmatimonadaceae bacterium]MBX9855383.1 hypothetical protein [Gemmatimonadaceae bacterium]